MTTRSTEEDFTEKKEENTSDGAKISRSNTTSSWSRLKDPRIVRVSRAFGGKDRHSKVCTVKGLRDRRVRLSVPTAIQLYDLQDRLGLNQPSKVVDWLLNVAKDEIDELPPLQIPQGAFGQGLQPMLASPPQVGKLDGHKTNNISSINWDHELELSSSSYWNSDKSKEIVRDTSQDTNRNGVEKHSDDQGASFVSASNLFSRTHHSPLPGLLHNAIPNNSFLRWDPSNLSLSQFGSQGLAPQQEDVLNFNIMTSLPPPSQLLVYPPQTQSYFPSHASSSEFDPRQIQFQMQSSSSSHNALPESLNPPLFSINQVMRPNFHLSMNPKFFPSQNTGGNGADKDD